MRVCELIHDYLVSQNVSTIFGVSGANIEDFVFTVTQKKQIQPILAKVESQACLMAMGAYLAAPDQLSVAFTTSGAGVLNAIPVLAESFSSEIPFVLIAGMIPQELQGHGGFQDTSGLNGSIDLNQLLTPISGVVHSIKREQDVLSAMFDCFATALSLKKPSVLLIPKNIFQREIRIEDQVMFSSFLFNPVHKINANKALKTHFIERGYLKNFPQEKMALSPAQLQKIKSIKQEKKILIILGEELIHLNDKNLIQTMLDQLDCRIAVTPLAKGLFDHGDLRFIGMTGVMGHHAVIQAAESSSCIFAIGSRFDHLTRLGIESWLTADKFFSLRSNFADGLSVDQLMSEVIHALQ